MNNIKAVFIKQATSLVKVPIMLVQGVVFLIIAVVMNFLLNEPEEYDCYVCVPAYVCEVCQAREDERFSLPIPSGISMFAVIFVGLALVGSASAMVSEDKTTMNLRFMAMADVRPWQYLLATLGSMIIAVSAMLSLFALAGGYFGMDFVRYMALGVSGGLVSVLFGITIGLSRFPLLAMPISIMLGLGPGFANANEALANVLRFTFIQQVNIGMAELDADLSNNFMIIGINGLVFLGIFFWMHRKNRFNV